MTFVPAKTITINGSSYDLRDATSDNSGLVKYYVLPDWATHRWGFKVRSVAPAPGVFPISSNIDLWPDTSYCNLGEDWQYFWTDLLAMAKYGLLLKNLDKTKRGYILKAFKGLTGSKAFITNYKGTDVYRNYPGNENTKKQDPQMESLICCGNNIFSDTVISTNDKRKKFVGVMTFKFYENPPVVTKETLLDPRVMYATTVRRNKTIGNFPHLGGTRVPYPVITRGQCWYPLEELLAS